MPRRSAPRNDSPDPLSFRGGPTGRRGNPSFLRWTRVRAAVPGAWPPPAKFRADIWGVGQVVVPYGWLRSAAASALGSGAQRSVCAAVAREWAGNAAEITPKVSSNAGQSLSHGLWPCQLPLHKGAFGDGDADCRVGPAGLLAMIMVFCHSEASAYTGRGNPSFFTMDGGLGRRVVGPYGKPDQPPSQPARSKASAPAAARNGRESTLEPSKRDKLPRSPGQRLAKRKARKEELVKFDFCPTSELCSTGYRVRRYAEGPARALVGAALIEQDSLGPHPAAR